jgi:hypothetical protein
VPLLIIAFLVAAIAIYFFPKVYPQYYARQTKVRKIALFLAFIIFSVIFTIGIFRVVNTRFGKQKVVRIEGFVAKKWMTRGQNGA